MTTWILPALLAAALAAAGVQTLRLSKLHQEVAERATVAAEGARIAERADAAQYRARTVAIQEITDANAAELRRVRAAADADLERLRNRPERPGVPESGTAARACAGATGAELARPDADFLVRYAAIARGAQVRLAECLQREAAVR